LVNTLCEQNKFNGSSTTTDNVFTEGTRKDHYSIKPVINELPNHDAQLIVINNIKLPIIITAGNKLD
jgi:hypothetical protein